MAFYDSDVLNEYAENLLTDNTYNVYVDANGYFLGVELFEGTKNYVFITGYDRPTSNLSVKTADAAAIFLDGTMEQIKVNVKDTNSNIEDLKNDEGTKAYFTKWTDDKGGEYAHNRWYTYTKTEAGVYTLKPCARMTATNYDAETTLNTANLRVSDNVKNTGKANVYGEDASVFLTVDLDEVDTTLDMSKTKRAITDVTGVYTGVQEADLEIDPGTAIEEAEVYTVYDSDYFIIGAIVVGEGKGSAANIAYIIDGAKSEEYKDGTYYWTFECVMDGTVQTLTAKSKYTDTIRALRSDKDNGDGIVELRFDGEYVVNVKDVKDIYNETHFDKSDATGKPTYVTSDFDVYDVKQGNELSLQGRTLYVLSNQADNGLALAKDAKAVVIQPENKKKDPVKTEFTSVEAAKNYLADADPKAAGLQYSGRIIAALDSTGAATWVLFDSKTPLNTGAQGGVVVTPGVTVTIGANNAITVTTTDKVLSVDEALKAIETFLTDRGLTVGTPYLANGVYQIPTFYDLGNGIKVPAQTYTFDPSTLSGNQNVTFYVNGDYKNPKTAKAGAFLSAVLNGEGKYVDIDGTKTLISSLTTTAVESGRNYVVKNAAGDTLVGVVGTKVVDTKADFLAGTVLSDKTAVNTVTFPKSATALPVTDGYYLLTINGTEKAIKGGTKLSVSGSYASVDGVMMAKVDADKVVVDKNMVINSGYYKLSVTNTAAIKATFTWSGDKVVKAGDDYYAQAGKATLTVSDATFVVGDTNGALKVGGATVKGVSIGNGTMNGTAAGSANGITFTKGQTYTGSFSADVTVSAADAAVTLTWAADLT